MLLFLNKKTREFLCFLYFLNLCKTCWLMFPPFILSVLDQWVHQLSRHRGLPLRDWGLWKRVCLRWTPVPILRNLWDNTRWCDWTWWNFQVQRSHSPGQHGLHRGRCRADRGGDGEGVQRKRLPPNAQELQPLLLCAVRDPVRQRDPSLGQPPGLLQLLCAISPELPA